MNDKNNILLISYDVDYAKILASKIIFLRKNDNIVISGFEDAMNFTEIYAPDIVLVHGRSDEKTLDLIKNLRKKEALCIILISDSNDAAFILSAYDYGADDFVLASADDFEFVLRIVHNIKHNSIKLLHLRNQKILEQSGVIDYETGIYNYNSAKQIIENYIDDNLFDCGTFLVVAPAEESKTKFNTGKMAEVLKNSVRVDDIITFGKGLKFYLMMPKTDLNQALIVFNKIKDYCCNDLDICAGLASISNKNFDQMEHDALNALSNALTKNMEYAFAEEKESTLDEWLDDQALHSKGYKIFRQIFNKKLEKVITPVFYRLQKNYEEKLFDTQIEQYTNEEQCVFRLSNKKQESTLRIIYPGFAKIIVYITHEGLDSPENREIQLALTKITQKELVKIVEDFIKEFKKVSV